jgi:hypothetical protein
MREMPEIKMPVFLAEKIFVVILLAILIPAAAALVWKVGRSLCPRASWSACGIPFEGRVAKLLGVLLAGIGGAILLSVATVLTSLVLSILLPGPVSLFIALGAIFLFMMCGLSLVGDTPVENLVKLVIFVVLFLILFPLFHQAREKGRAKACMTHMKQVGAAMRMYASDYDGHLPQRANWCDAVLPYVQSSEDRPARSVFACPSLRDQPSGQAYNAQLSGILESRIALPSTTAEVFDASGGWNLAGGAERAVRRHYNGLCLLFTDGHVRWLQSLGGVVWKPALIRLGTGR